MDRNEFTPAENPLREMKTPKDNKQETSMRDEKVTEGGDEFLVEVNRMRTSLNALSMKYIMFDAKEEEVGGVKEEVPPPLPVAMPPSFPQSDPPSALKECDEINLSAAVPIAKAVTVPAKIADDPIKPADPPSVLKKSDEILPITREIAIEPIKPADLSLMLTVEPPKSADPTPSVTTDQPPPFKRTLSNHNLRQDSNRTYSGLIEKEDVLKAIIIESSKQANADVVSPTNSIEKTKSRVHFAEETTKLLKNSSRESDEVANINDLPWQKKHEYRTVTPFFKQKNKIKALSSEQVDTKVETTEAITFRPIERNRSIEDFEKSIVRPVPIFASKSYQELSKNDEDDSNFKKYESFEKTKSNEDLLLDNLDGARKFTESRTHKLVRMRSVSKESLNRTSDIGTYENINFQSQSSIDENLIRKTKKPMPQPRSSIQEDPRASKRTSKTIVYVLDKQKNEFVLENPELLEDAYESVLVNNEVDQFRDSKLFSALLNSREDCKSLLNNLVDVDHAKWCLHTLNCFKGGLA